MKIWYGSVRFQSNSTFIKKVTFLPWLVCPAFCSISSVISILISCHAKMITKISSLRSFILRHSKWHQNCCCCRIQSPKSSKERGASYGYFVRTVGHNLTAGQNVGTDVEEMNLGIIAQVKPVE